MKKGLFPLAFNPIFQLIPGTYLKIEFRVPVPTLNSTYNATWYDTIYVYLISCQITLKMSFDDVTKYTFARENHYLIIIFSKGH